MSEGPVNLNWGPIMKHVNDNPFEFFQQGGWSFLGGAGGAEVSVTHLPFTATPHVDGFRANIPQHPVQSLILKPSLMKLFRVLVQMKKVTILMLVEVTKVDLTLEVVMIAKKVSLMEIIQIRYLTRYDFRRRLG